VAQPVPLAPRLRARILAGAARVAAGVPPGPRSRRVLRRALLDAHAAHVLVGAQYLAWTLILGTVMAVEKNVSWGRRLSAPLGVVLVTAGVVVGVAGYRGMW